MIYLKMLVVQKSLIENYKKDGMLDFWNEEILY